MLTRTRILEPPHLVDWEGKSWVWSSTECNDGDTPSSQIIAAGSSQLSSRWPGPRGPSWRGWWWRPPRCPGPKCWEFVHWTLSRSQLLWCLSLTSLQYLSTAPLNVYSSSSWAPETLMTVSGGQELQERNPPPLSSLPTAEAPAVLIPFTGRNPLPHPGQWSGANRLSGGLDNL